MTTKKNPGKFNCYAKLADDEPYFVLRGKDPVAPYLVLAWREIRSGNVDAAKCFMVIAMHALKESGRELLPKQSDSYDEGVSDGRD